MATLGDNPKKGHRWPARALTGNHPPCVGQAWALQPGLADQEGQFTTAALVALRSDPH